MRVIHRMACSGMKHACDLCSGMRHACCMEENGSSWTRLPAEGRHFVTADRKRGGVFVDPGTCGGPPLFCSPPRIKLESL